MRYRLLFLLILAHTLILKQADAKGVQDSMSYYLSEINKMGFSCPNDMRLEEFSSYAFYNKKLLKKE